VAAGSLHRCRNRERFAGSRRGHSNSSRLSRERSRDGQRLFAELHGNHTRAEACIGLLLLVLLMLLLLLQLMGSLKRERRCAVGWAPS
jgi:hypothetical protein